MVLLKKFNIALLVIFFYAYSLYLKKFFSFIELQDNLKKNNIKKKLNISSKAVLSISNKIFKFFKIRNCLSSAMTVYFVLKVCGKSPKLFIGSAFNESDFISHAWIEVEDLIFHTNPQNIDILNKIIEIR